MIEDLLDLVAGSVIFAGVSLVAAAAGGWWVHLLWDVARYSWGLR